MKKSLLAKILILSLLFACVPSYAFGLSDGTSPASSFTDIDGHWAEQAIAAYADSAVFSDPKGQFMPDAAITRSEFVQMLHQALDINIQYFRATDIKEYFQDVSNEDVYAGKLYDLAMMDMIDYRGAFRPKDPLPRDEMVHYIMNALKNRLGGSLPVNQYMLKQFGDDGQISPAYKDDVYQAMLLSMVFGRGNNLFVPKNACTRAEAAVMMERLNRGIQEHSKNVLITVSAIPEADQITMNLTIMNNTGEPVILNYTSGQRYDFALLDGNKESLYTWSADKLFIQQLSSETLAAGASIGYSEILDSDQYLSIKDRIAFMKATITGQSPSIPIRPEGYLIPVSDFSSN